ncbi:LEA type 2 family protein [Paraburkholderia sp. BCC1885]|uniref:LEA type 2 family protein n=1 Tax=Paraburkholderia sp. BCC1885 TaxID=2562669 RepID=UPI001181E5A0|nr:LEA type 2 family protein [Paraburkholderia sp. BCC1885]
MPFLRLLLSGRSARLLAVGLLSVVTLGACAGWFGHDPLRVSLASVEPLDSQGMETHFNVKLRIQNPNGDGFSFNGVAVDLQLNGRSFATGVSPQQGSVPSYGEVVVTVPVTAPAFASLEHAYSVADAGTPPGQYPYILQGRLGRTTGGTRFLSQGVLSLPGIGIAAGE